MRRFKTATQSYKSRHKSHLKNGAIAQLVARLHGMQEVTSSTLVSSTSLRSYELRLAGQPNGRDCQTEIVRAKAARRSSLGKNSELLFIQSEGGLFQQTQY